MAKKSLNPYRKANCILHLKYPNDASVESLNKLFSMERERISKDVENHIFGDGSDPLKTLDGDNIYRLTADCSGNKVLFSCTEDYINTMLKHHTYLRGIAHFKEVLSTCDMQPIIYIKDASSGLKYSKLTIFITQSVFSEGDECTPGTFTIRRGRPLVVQYTLLCEYITVDGNIGTYSIKFHSMKDLKDFVENRPSEDDSDKYFTWLTFTLLDFLLLCSYAVYDSSSPSAITFKSSSKYIIANMSDTVLLEDIPYYNDRISLLYMGTHLCFNLASKGALNEKFSEIKANLQTTDDSEFSYNIGVYQEALLEANRPVFVFNNRVVDKLKEKYGEEIIVTEEASMCLPYPLLSLYNEDSGIIYNISFAKGVTPESEAVYIVTIIDNNYRPLSCQVGLCKPIKEVLENVVRDMASVPEDSKIYDSKYYDFISEELQQAAVDSFYILYHIANVTSQKIERSLARASNLTGDNEESLANHDGSAVTQNSQQSLSERQLEDDTEEDADYRERYSSPLQLFSLTPRTYKKVKLNKERARGWKQPKHIRSGHIHHYWVGKKGERKLIAKWVEPTVVNKDMNDSPATTLRRMNLD